MAWLARKGPELRCALHNHESNENVLVSDASCCAQRAIYHHLLLDHFVWGETSADLPIEVLVALFFP